MEGSTLGAFHTRLAMLLAFHCHVLLAPKQEGHGEILYFIVAFYSWR